MNHRAWILPITAWLLAGGSVARAQDSGHRPGVPGGRSAWRRGVVHYGKWVAAAGAVGLTVLGVQEHRNSAREWDLLLDICRADNSHCATGADGRYPYYPAELHYQKAVYYDHRARHRLLGGQLSLLGAAAMFIADIRPDKGPGNIPFHALEVAPRRGGDGVNVGVRFAF